MQTSKVAVGVITVAWLAIIPLLLNFDPVCDSDNAAVIFKCMTANEIGDFLAGMFAPLAFVWLAFAVFIQTNELQEQRKELTLTREELELSRGVAEEAKKATLAQAEEAKRSGDYFQQQTEILEYEHKIRRETKSVQDIRVLLEYPPKMADTFKIESVVIDGVEWRIPTQYWSVDKILAFSEAIKEATKIEVPSDHISGLPMYSYCVFLMNWFETLLHYFETYSEAMENISNADRVRYGDDNRSQYIWVIKDLISALKNFRYRIIMYEGGSGSE